MAIAKRDSQENTEGIGENPKLKAAGFTGGEASRLASLFLQATPR